MQTLRIGLTGGIGSGKSTVGALLAARGCAVIDADALSRSLTAAQGRAMPAIARVFGAEMVAPDGSMDRARMRERVFRDPAAKQQLEALLHPLVGELADEAAQDALRQGHTCLVFDVPLLVESGRWRARVDRVWVVDCLPETQKARVMSRSGLSAEAVSAIMTAQATRRQRLAAADAVIYNDGLSLTGLEAEVAALWHHQGASGGR